jgi:hypothetical protein
VEEKEATGKTDDVTMTMTVNMTATEPEQRPKWNPWPPILDANNHNCARSYDSTLAVLETVFERKWDAVCL